MNKALLSLALGGFGIGMTEFVIMGILPDVAGALQVSIPTAGHFITAYALGVVVGAPILTVLGSNRPSKQMLLFLMLWFTVFNTLSAFAPDYWTLLAARFLSGLPHGAFFGIGAVVATRLAKKGKEAQGIAMMFTGLTVANVIGVPIGTYFGHNFGWNISFIMVGVIGLLAIAGIQFWMPILPPGSSGSIKSDFQIFKRLELWLVILLTTIGTGGFFAWYSYIAPLITQVSGHPDYMVGYAMILAGIGMSIGNLLGARLANRFLPIHAVIITLVMMVLVLLLNTVLAENKIAVLMMTFIIGVITFCIAAPIQLTMINSAKGGEMLGSSMNQSAFNMGNASGAYFGGLPIAMGYGFTSADYVGAAMAFAGILISLLIIYVRKSQKKQIALSV